MAGLSPQEITDFIERGAHIAHVATRPARRASPRSSGLFWSMGWESLRSSL